jgi:hypothetical protein
MKIALQEPIIIAIFALFDDHQLVMKLRILLALS